MSEPSQKEKHALIEAATAFEEHGIDFRMPWECDLDDLERERYEALREACQAYAKEIRNMLGEIGDQLDGILDKYQMPKTMPIGWTDVDYERIEDWVEPMRREIERLREVAHAAAIS